MAFHLFSQLPPELRQQIWRQSLPTELPATCFPYKAGGWQVRKMQPGDEGYDHEFENNGFDYESEYNFCLTYDTMFLDPVLTEPALLFVSREARSVARKWLLQHDDVKAYITEDSTKSTAFASQFRPDYDVMYVDGLAWDSFMHELPDIIDEWQEIHDDDDLTFFEAHNEYPVADVKFLAIASHILISIQCYEDVVARLEDYRHLQELWIVCDELPDIDTLALAASASASHYKKLNQRWEMTTLGEKEMLSFGGSDNDPSWEVEVGDVVGSVKAKVEEWDESETFKHLVYRPVKAVKRKMV